MKNIGSMSKGIVKNSRDQFVSGDWVEGYYAYKGFSDTHVILVEVLSTQFYGSYFTEVEVDPKTVERVMVKN